MSLENSYAAAIAQIKTEIETIRLKAAISVNQHLLMLYWKIGSIILEQQSTEGWGTKVIERLSFDLRREFPDMKGASARNLNYMKSFAEAYPEFMQQPATQIRDNSIMQAPLAKIESERSIVQQAAAQLEKTAESILQQPVAKIEITDKMIPLKIILRS
ncbi:MAG: DUF1016 N-terminal domain-containing protein, partial [Mucilaginibacter sp.]